MATVAKNSIIPYGVFVEEMICDVHADEMRLNSLSKDLTEIGNKIARFHDEYLHRDIFGITPELYHEQLNKASEQIEKAGDPSRAQQTLQKLAMTLELVERPPLSKRIYTAINLLRYDVNKVRVSEEALTVAAKILRVYQHRLESRLHFHQETKQSVSELLQKTREVDPLSSKPAHSLLSWWRSRADRAMSLPVDEHPEPESAIAPKRRKRPDWVKQLLDTEIEALPSMQDSPILMCLSYLLSRKRDTSKILLPQSMEWRTNSSVSEGFEVSRSSLETRENREEAPPREPERTECNDPISVESLGDIPKNLLGARSILEPPASETEEVKESSWVFLNPSSSTEKNETNENLFFWKEFFSIYELYNECENRKKSGIKRYGIAEKVLPKISSIKEDLIKLSKSKPSSEEEKTARNAKISKHRQTLTLYIHFLQMFKEETSELNQLKEDLSNWCAKSAFSEGFDEETITTLKKLRFPIKSLVTINQFLSSCKTLTDSLISFFSDTEKMIHEISSCLDSSLYYLKLNEGNIGFCERPLSYLFIGNTYLQEAINTIRRESWETDPSLKMREIERIERALGF